MKSRPRPIIRRAWSQCSFFSLLLLLSQAALAADAFVRITPAQAGYDPARLEQLRDLLAERGSESMLLLKDGHIFFEFGDIHAKRTVHSIRKPLLSALIGTELGKGCLELDKTLADYGIDERPPGLTDTEKSATLRQVLQSRSGVFHPATAETESMAAQRPARGSHAPGAFYYYNNWDFNVAGAIFEKCAGQGVHEAFAERIAEPLGMQDFSGRIVSLPDMSALPDWADGFRQLEPGVSRFRAYHFRLSAHDLALFGQLYLQRGKWRGRELIPDRWVDESTAPVSVTNAEYGLAYGMLWSSLVPSDPPPARPSFYHSGVGVHMIGVYPELGLVMVHRVNTEQPFKFNGGDLYAVIRAMHGARIR